MSRFICTKCEKRFEMGAEAPMESKKCPHCGSIKIKMIGLVPDRGFIRAFMLYKSTKCRACGRTLTSEKSIERGFGPGCALYFAEKWLDTNPADLGPGARKKWTKEEVDSLIEFALDYPLKKEAK